MNKLHKCVVCFEKTSDVTIGKDGIIKCRRCGGKLEDSQVIPEMLAYIRKKWKKR